jgi:hypothetical protein
VARNGHDGVLFICSANLAIALLCIPLLRSCAIALLPYGPLVQGPIALLSRGPIALLLNCPITPITLLPCCPPALDYSVLSCSDSNPPLWPLLSNPTSDLLFVFMDASLIGCLSRSRSWSPRARSLAISHPIPLPIFSSDNRPTPPPLHPSTPQPPSFPFLPLPSRDRSWMQPTHPTPLHKLRFLSTATPLGLHRKTARVQGKSRVAGVLPLQVANHTSDWMRALSMFFNPTVVEVVAPFTHSLTHSLTTALLFGLSRFPLFSLSLSLLLAFIILPCNQ